VIKKLLASAGQAKLLHPGHVAEVRWRSRGRTAATPARHRPVKTVHPLHPASLQKPSGYTHGFAVSGGRRSILRDRRREPREIPNDDFVDQFDRALAAVLEVVKEAGASRRT